MSKRYIVDQLPPTLRGAQLSLKRAHPEHLRRLEDKGEDVAAGADARSKTGAPLKIMLMGDQIAKASLTDWRKLAQGLHARYRIDSFGSGARFITAVGEAGSSMDHYPRVSMGKGYVDLELVSEDAIYRDEKGTEHIVEWVTQADVDLAKLISTIAADHRITADPTSVSEVELGIDTSHATAIAPVWAALLTGDGQSQGRGSLSEEIRDAAGHVPNLWFGNDDGSESSPQRFHIEVYVSPEVVQQRIAAILAAGGIVIDDSQTPSFTVFADQDGNQGALCVDMSAVNR